MFDEVLNLLPTHYALRTSYRKVSKKQLHGLAFILIIHEKYLKESTYKKICRKKTDNDASHMNLYKVLLTTGVAKFSAISF